MKRRIQGLALISIALLLASIIYVLIPHPHHSTKVDSTETVAEVVDTSEEYEVVDIADVEYDGEIAIEVNNNKPDFTKEEIDRANEEEFEDYSELDALGRCGVACANICEDLMPDPNEKRSSLYEVTPSGWQRINFWSRCHLIGYQLAGENANELNLITGTSRFNVSGMLPYENEVADYIHENKENHVLYKVIPLYSGKNLVANGVNMQAMSLEDNGASVSYNVYVFNIQPGYIIDYKTGEVDKDPNHVTVVKLSDKTASYTGEPVEIGEANVEGSTGTVKYIYYTDKEGKTRTTESVGAQSKGGAPVYKGVYYVRAVVSGDNWYPTATSEPARLEIK